MLTKALSGLKITDASQGRVQAVFATFNVKDHDGDVTLPGAFEDNGAVRISAYNHASWGGALPVGKGTIGETADGAVLDGQFFMNTAQGRDTFETVKQMGDLQEWSYGYDIVDASEGQLDGEDVQFIRKQLVYEVSPVLLGAGIDTRTLAAKHRGPACAECGKHTTPLFDALGGVKALICPACGEIARKQLDSDLEEALSDAGTQRFGSADIYVYLYDHDVDENFAVFALCSNSGSYDSQLVRVEFTRGDDGSVTLQPGQENVEVETSFVPEKRKSTGSASAAPAADNRASDAEGDGNAPKALHDESEQRLKLAEHLATVQTAVDELAGRLAAATKQRAEQGDGQLADATLERVEQLAASAERLREAVAIEPPQQPKDDDAPDGDRRLTLEDETQLAEFAARHGLSI